VNYPFKKKEKSSQYP